MNGPRLRMTDIWKRFDADPVLRAVDVEASAGEVHGLVGENGAGKSTLIRILAGALTPDRGEVAIDGAAVQLGSPGRAHQAGIRVVYQEFSLAPNLSIPENVLLGELPRTRYRLIDWRTDNDRAASLFERLGFEVPNLRVPVSQLPVSTRQVVEIAKAISREPTILVLDEPSAVLSGGDLDQVFQAIRDLRSKGTTVLYVSHRLQEVFEIADRITVLKDGAVVATVPTSAVDEPAVIRMMVGRPIEEIFPVRAASTAAPILTVERLSRPPAFRDVSLAVRPGEILGVFGLVGSGRSEVARGIFGADRIASGRMTLDGAAYRPGSPADALQAGVAMVSEDRARDGLVLPMAVRDNVSLAALSRMTRAGFLMPGRQDALVDAQVKRVHLRGATTSDVARRLSGGNQQKVVLAKWLLRNARVLILDEPTRGVDVGAKAEIYRIVADLAERGVAVILISSELPEVLGMSDRVLVMRAGQIVAELSRAQASEERCLAAAAGVAMEAVA